MNHKELEAEATRLFNSAIAWRKCTKCGSIYASPDDKHCGVEGEITIMPVRFVP